MGIKGRKRKANRILAATSSAVPKGAAERFPKHVVVAFVEELQTAHQYFLFKEYLRLDCTDSIKCIMYFGYDFISREDVKEWTNKFNLVEEEEIEHCIKSREDAKEWTNKFNLIQEEDIEHCIKEYIVELKEEQVTYLKNLKNIEERLENNMFNLLVEEADILDAIQDDIFKVEQVPVMNMDLKEIRNPIFYLVFRMREEGYVLDENLEVELEKLKTFAPMYYRDCLDGWKPAGMVEEGTVTVSNISLDVSEIDIRKFYAFRGEIKYVRTRSTSKGQIAYITFKDLFYANVAHRYTGTKSPHLSMYIKSPGYSGYAPLVVQAISDEDARYIDEKVEEDVHNMHAEAHYKHNEIRTYYCQFSKSQPNDVDGCKIEQHWGVCPWMEMEAMANGGYTVGGQSLDHTPELLENQLLVAT